MRALRDLARRLLEERAVDVVIGWEEGPRGARPAFVTAPGDAQRLVFDVRCVHNLIAYLSPRRSHVRALGRPAVVVKGCDLRALAGLVREGQLARESVVTIGVRCSGVLDARSGPCPPGREPVSGRCFGCRSYEPRQVDHAVDDPAAPRPPDGGEPSGDELARLEAMDPAARLAFWRARLSRCTRCHACREVCPMCFCVRCVADKSEPRWVPGSPHPAGNLSWHVTRAIHQAGRCVGCRECERACPMGIPLSLLNAKLSKTVEERFGHVASDDASAGAPIGQYSLDDPQEFIR